jgi:branched-chain amino acid transport system substrate-binding protein
VRTFARLQPGDPLQAEAQVVLMRTLGVRSVYLLDDQDPFSLPLAELVADDAVRAGIKVIAHDSLSIVTGGVFAGEAEKVAQSGAQAVFYSGAGSEGAAELWRALHSADPHLAMFAPSSTDIEPFTSQLGSAEASTHLTTPVLPAALYSPAGRRVLGSYRRVFGSEGNGYALYGYEAMSLVLDAIRRAGTRGNDRRVVIERLLSTRNRLSVLGRYSIEPDGDTTLSRFAVERVSGGHSVFVRAIDVARR